MSFHPVTQALNNLVKAYGTNTVAEWFNTTPATISRNSRGGQGYENGPHFDHQQIKQLHISKFPSKSGFLA